jgi:hypothetical protein
MAFYNKNKLEEDFVLTSREMEVKVTADQCILGVDAKGKIQVSFLSTELCAL